MSSPAFRCLQAAVRCGPAPQASASAKYPGDDKHNDLLLWEEEEIPAYALAYSVRRWRMDLDPAPRHDPETPDATVRAAALLAETKTDDYFEAFARVRECRFRRPSPHDRRRGSFRRRRAQRWLC